MTIPTTSMRDRAAGELVIEQLLDVQGDARPRSAISRLLGRSPLSDDSFSWYQGALGEIAVGRILARLPSDWTVFHALPVGTKDSDIDHLVAGPGGVFTINTKHHRGKPIWVGANTFMVSGHRQPHLRNAVHEADRVTRMLGERMSTPVQPMLVLVDPKGITIRTPPERVKVLDARYLLGWLRARPEILSPADLGEVVAMLDNPATWREGTASEPDLMVRFERLDREVRSARIRQRLWTLGFSGAVVAGSVALIQSLPQLIASVLR